ncbi:integrase [Crenobacter caeni]|uniref:Integrase n=1 Tax=Crenobacter caeni TaxID=2705474 RepID=A0A6B2KSE2_9NEIS|nr:integrase [Crenobacter caeni]NDV13003.1 integrase [Crenobacter caeni]
MSNILLFKPKTENDARANLEEFIALCRNKLTVFGANLDWDSSSWPKVCNFTVIGAPSRGYSQDQLLDEQIIPFAKAYIRYQQGHNPTKLKGEIKAIRCIERSLLQVKGKADITLVDGNVMDVAVEVAREYQATAYQAGIALKKLVFFLNESRIIPRQIIWENPISKPSEITRTDAETKAKRAAKIPNEQWLDWMAEMFANNLPAPRDRFTTSIFALMMCAPSRISEIQDLPVNCLHYEVDNQGTKCVGLRFYAGKGFGADIKWSSEVFNATAIEAVRRLTELSEEGRKLARWYEENPERFYRHENCPNVGEMQPLTDAQACRALGLKENYSSNSLRKYFRDYTPYQTLKATGDSLTLAFLNTYCRSKLPEGWPWKNKERNIKYSEALCCFRWNELRSDMEPSPVLLGPPGKSMFTSDLSYTDTHKHSIWMRHGYKNPDGSEISMTSHQIRHYLNTIGQRGGLGELYIARWSGRANVHQNATYNHMTTDEYVELAKGVGIGTALAKIKKNMPVTFSDLDAMGEGIAHVTEFGFCIHDFSMLPCQKHRDCLNCVEQVCVKGDEGKLQRLRQQRDGIRLQLKKAYDATDSGEYDMASIDRWTTHQIKTLERVDQLIHILESPETENGAVIRMRHDQEFSPLKRVLAAKSKAPKLVAPANKNEAPNMDDLRTLLGV